MKKLPEYFDLVEHYRTKPQKLKTPVNTET